MNRYKNQIYVGAMWRKGNTSKGDPMLSANIDIDLDFVKANTNKDGLKINFLVFRNKKKEEGSKQPDYNFVIFEDDDNKDDTKDEVPW